MRHEYWPYLRITNDDAGQSTDVPPIVVDNLGENFAQEALQDWNGDELLEQTIDQVLKKNRHGFGKRFRHRGPN